MKQLLAITISALTLASAARAETAIPNAPAAAPDPSQKIVCVRSQAETGSHFGASKVCHTESEWTMIHSQSTHTMERYDTIQNKQDRSLGGR